MKYIKLLITSFLIIFFSEKLYATEFLIHKLKAGGNIVMIRHAYAPGNGDPNNFSIKDCLTQRNLDKNGIDQSKAIGKFFKINDVPIDIILSSEWCRCKDTALYDFKKFETKSFLNSFYDIKLQGNKKEQMKELKKYIKNWKSNKNLILITHYVVISELLNISAQSGEIIISDSKLNVIGKIRK